MIAKLWPWKAWMNPPEIVIHVNMLKEGWDVTNLYHHRAPAGRQCAHADRAVHRSRFAPAYGKRTGVAAVDRLNIVAHDKFQEIIDEANRGDSPIRLKQVIPEAPSADDKKVSVQVSSRRHGPAGSCGAPSVATKCCQRGAARPLRQRPRSRSASAKPLAW